MFIRGRLKTGKTIEEARANLELLVARLATTYPHPGGDYHYLTRALGRRFAFLFAWARISVIQTGSIALLAFIFADYATEILPLGTGSSTVYAALCVIVLTALNVAGVRQGKSVQNALTALEVPHDVKVYQGSGHRFMTETSGAGAVLARFARMGYQEADAADAWQRIYGFFGEHLGT